MFSEFFQVVPYAFFEGVMALVVIFELGYTVFERWDML